MMSGLLVLLSRELGRTNYRDSQVCSEGLLTRLSGGPVLACKEK